jgi:AcrR family transcriptional regulator
MSSEKRSYQLKERARRQAETRRRIVAATVELHEDVGPAATTVTEIAERAGVSRLTVYQHFPTDGDLFSACQHQFLTEHPPSDVSTALALDDPVERVGSALAVLYRSYRRQAPMTGNVLRDRKLLPALDALLTRTLDERQATLAAALTAGFELDRKPRRRLHALIALALEFSTWQRLTADGLSDAEAAATMADSVAHTAVARNRGAAAGATTPRR